MRASWFRRLLAPPLPRPAFELLEDRLLFAAHPVATVAGGGDVLLGETAHVTVTFDNVPDATPGSNVGFAPYVDLILPTKGADGTGPGITPPETKDGVTFQGATLLGQPVQATSVEFDANGDAVHPFARDASGQLRVVHASDYGAQPGDTLVTLQLPFGSFTPDRCGPRPRRRGRMSSAGKDGSRSRIERRGLGAVADDGVALPEEPLAEAGRRRGRLRRLPCRAPAASAGGR